MRRLPAAFERLLHELTRLPGVGRRGAERLAMHLLESEQADNDTLADAITRLKREVLTCQLCGNWSEGERCAICSDEQRATGQLCVVERPPDLWALEQTGAFSGRYHVLGGTLSPLAGVTAEDLRIDALERRIQTENIREIILATNPSLDGDATAHYLARRFAGDALRISRIAQGVPLGSHLDYADAGTLRLALEGRRSMQD